MSAQEWIVPAALRVTAESAEEADRKARMVFVAMGQDRMIGAGVELDSLIDAETYPAPD